MIPLTVWLTPVTVAEAVAWSVDQSKTLLSV